MTQAQQAEQQAAEQSDPRAGCTVSVDRSAEGQRRAAEAREAREARSEAMRTARVASLTAEDAHGYALRASRHALAGWQRGSADASDVAQETLTRLLAAAGPAARAWAAACDTATLAGWHRRAISATVRNVARETMAGRTQAEREAPLPLSFDVPARTALGAEDGEGASASLTDLLAVYGTVGTQQRDREALTEASIILGALTEAGVNVADGTATLADGSTVSMRGGYRCAADAVGLVVTLPDGTEAADPWAYVRLLTLRTEAAASGSTAQRGAQAATQAVAAAGKHAAADRAILAAVEAYGSMREAAAACGITVSAGRSRLRAAKLRAAGQTTNRKAGNGRGTAAAAA